MRRRTRYASCFTDYWGSLDLTWRTTAPEMKVTYSDMIRDLIFITRRNVPGKNELFVSGNKLLKCVCA